ncbi:tetratricopeptide repeat protein [Yoonia sp. BS5-3]|uniref:Tetratricopeptide repeat protein n=1 Tax=Yoonia phaeophyticola TaxID=3137369 RepID=A0ABZ2V5F8_9RHOB
MVDLNDDRNPVGLSPDATKVAAQVFAACTKKLGVDGSKIFQSFLDTGSFKEALGVTDAAIEGLYGRAHQQFRIGQYDRAEEIFRTLCALDRSRSDFWVGLGICYRVRGDDDAALRMFDCAAKLVPSSAIPHFHRFDIFMRQEKWAAAARACAAFEAKSDGSEHENIGKTFAKLKTALEIRRG